MSCLNKSNICSSSQALTPYLDIFWFVFQYLYIFFDILSLYLMFFIKPTPHLGRIRTSILVPFGFTPPSIVKPKYFMSNKCYLSFKNPSRVSKMSTSPHVFWKPSYSQKQYHRHVVLYGGFVPVNVVGLVYLWHFVYTETTWDHLFPICFCFYGSLCCLKPPSTSQTLSRSNKQFTQ